MSYESCDIYLGPGGAGGAGGGGGGACFWYETGILSSLVPMLIFTCGNGP